MKLSQFQFALDADKIAKNPPRWRDECKLMVLHKDSGEIEHKLFKNIIEYFGKGDTFVLNDTKVFPARLYGNKEKTGASIEVNLLRELNREQRLWDVIVDPLQEDDTDDTYHLLWSSDRLEIAREIDSRLTKIYSDLVSLEKMMAYKYRFIDFLRDVSPLVDSEQGRKLTVAEECKKQWISNARKGKKDEE